MILYNKSNIRAWDSETIALKKIASIELMETAATVFVKWFTSLYFDKNRTIVILAGIGNNGGDALAVARLLHEQGYDIQIYFFEINTNWSPDCKTNFERIKGKNINHYIIKEETKLFIGNNAIIIDGIFGSGLSKPISGWIKQQIIDINELENIIISIDIPSGVDSDIGVIGPALKADRTLSFEIPKMAFFLKETNEYIGEWDYKSIGLIPEFQTEIPPMHFMVTREMIANKFKKRTKFQSKSDFGYGQLCGGSQKMLGAVILSANAAIKSGIGRLVITTPKIHHPSLFNSCPIAMVQFIDDENEFDLEYFEKTNSLISAIACGPGLGTKKSSVSFLNQLFSKVDVPLLLDADALNIISREDWQTRIPKFSILTPHHFEFERLINFTGTHFELLEQQIKFSTKHQVYVVLKGAHSSISTPEGYLYFNNSGNVGMATAGSGDVLTGLLLSLLAQGYTQLETCQMGVFIHGLAGDLAAEKYGQISMTALDIIEFIPQVIKSIYGK